LNTDVRGRFELQVTTRLVVIEVAGKCPFDVPRSRVVALDQIAVVAVHDPNDVCQVCSR
jgi:hypothetical protein